MKLSLGPPARRGLALVTIFGGLTAGLALAMSGPGAHVASGRSKPRVLRVGTYKGIAGQYRTIQAAVDAARPGDWILVAPGDYHERADHRTFRGPQSAETPAGLIIAKPRIHLRGMNRNRVVLDGTLPGSARCSARKSNQDFGIRGTDHKRLGRNGILVWKVDGVSVENLTACNFLNGAGSVGNEIWWNGGDGGGKIGLRHLYGSYLTATSTYFAGDGSTAAQYGIFSSNASGGRWDHMYASNMSDSNFYVGACQQVCNQVINDVHSQYSSQGYSGTNAGGKVVIENSEFDHNRSGFTAGALNNDDWPAPQNGACPKGVGQITHTYSCWVFIHNYVHDNNNPNVPGVGIATEVPLGSGILLYGGRNNTIMDNVFANNGAWGIIEATFPDTETPPNDVIAAGYDCRGGVGGTHGGQTLCAFDDWGNAIINNTFRHNGYWNPNNGNADFAEVTSTAAATNCFRGNREAGGGSVSSSPPGLQQLKPKCTRQTVPPDPNPQGANQAACDSQALSGIATSSTPCTPGSYYPKTTKIVMPPLPRGLKTMPNPCKGVPANPWCPARRGGRAE